MATLSAETYREQRDRAVALAYNLATWIDGQPSKRAAKQVDRLVAQFKEEQVNKVYDGCGILTAQFKEEQENDTGTATEDVVADS